MKVLFKISLTSFISLFSIAHTSCSKGSTAQVYDLPNTDQYISWNVNGNKGAFTSPMDSLASARYGIQTHITGASTNNQNGVYFIFSGNRANGIYEISFSDIYINQVTYSALPNSLQATVTKYGSVGDYIIGSYSGNVKDSTSKTIAISGNFKVKTR